MSTDQNIPSLSVEDCRASGSDPQLGVHELSECAYCRRAFLILHENRELDSGAEREINLDYEPAYFQREIEAEVRFLRKLQLWVSGFCILVLVISVILGLLGHPFVLWGALLATVLCFGFLGLITTRIVTLQKILNGYDDAQAVLPDEAAEEIQDVDWRALIAAEFEPRRYENALIDTDLKLGGKPWCYLRKGDLHIPVFLYRMQDTDAKKRVHRQHLVRLAAYCHLIESRERRPSAHGIVEQHASPYGIVLFADSFVAKVIPNNHVSRQAFLDTLLDARRTFHDSLDGRDPEMAGRRFCSSCHWGYPVRCEKGESPFTSNGKPLPVSRQPSMEGTEVYHSWCCDRFLQCPPHAKAVEYGIYKS
jgi:hypothetical protein